MAFVEYYVDHAVGADGNLGTSEGAGNAWEHVQHAVDNTGAGDRINIKAVGGDYVWDEADQNDHDANTCLMMDAVGGGGNLAAGTWKVLEGYTTTIGDGGMVVFDANNDTKRMMFIDDISNTCYRNITFQNTSRVAERIILLDNGAGTCINTIFENCVITDGRYGLTCDNYAKGVYLINCTIHNTNWDGTFFAGSIWFYNCKVYNCDSGGIRHVGGQLTCINSIVYNCGRPIHISNAATAALIINCTLYDANWEGVVVNHASSTGMCINTVVSSSGSENFEQAAGTLTGMYNCSHNTGAPDNITDWGNSTNDFPRFADAAGADFTVRDSGVLYGGTPDERGNIGIRGAITGARRNTPLPQRISGAPITGAF